MPDFEPSRRAAWLPLASLAVASLAAADPAAPSTTPSSERQAELRHLLFQDCGSCHGLTLKGGLGPPLLPQALAGKDEATLAAIVLEGVPGTPMPPWAGEITVAEARWLAAVLKDEIP